ncbi:MAG: wax ester/triacylglycerol synthase family O-acyltransferase [Actinomycetota bacterium]|nr:wax ester/triacylglycerol synthase family O-acyltransferase [Actinomycetota bacterium]
MKQLSGIDASFLYMETATSFGHVSGLSIFERPDIAGWSPYEAFRRQLESRLPILEPLRRRVVEVPLQLDHPYWIEDPDFDLDYHLRETAVPPPGDERQLAELVARIVGRPLDRAHPLWESYVIEGLSDNRFAVLTKLHHSTIDGAAGAELTTILFDADPSGSDAIQVYDDREPERVPSPAEVLGRAFTDVLRKPRKLVRLQIRSLRALGQLTRNQGLTGLAEVARSVPSPFLRRRSSGRPEQDGPSTPPRTAAPPTPFNRAITAHRRLELRSVSLSEVKAIKAAAGATLNDVVMAMCAGALRSYLLEHDALPESPLVAMIPVSIRTGDEADKWSNRVSSIFTPIPTDEADPIQRVKRVHEAMDVAKERFALLPADMLTDYAQFSPPALAARAARVATRLRVADRLNSPVNVVISNVPGPREALYLAGAKLLHYYPVSTIVEGQGLNITVQSYRDTLDFGLVGARELVPDLDRLADGIVAEMEALADATGVTRPASGPTPGARAAAKATKRSRPSATTRSTAARSMTEALPAKRSAVTRSPAEKSATKSATKKTSGKKAPARKSATRKTSGTGTQSGTPGRRSG